MTVIFATLGIAAFLALAIRFPKHAGHVTRTTHCR
jgi:hypothetical protein